MTSAYAQRIIQHFEKVWARSANRRRWEFGPIRELPTDFCILEFAPSPSRNMWTYATCCMSQVEDAPQIELHLFAPEASDLHVELLTTIAHYHRTGCKIGLGDSVNFGRPWLEDSTCSFGILSLPYLDGPQLEHLIVPELHMDVECYWLIPITQQEVEYKKRVGVDRLEKDFEESSFDYIDPKRKSVVGDIHSLSNKPMTG